MIETTFFIAIFLVGCGISAFAMIFQGGHDPRYAEKLEFRS